MTELINGNDISANKDLDPPVVEVFFNDGDSVSLYTAAPRSIRLYSEMERPEYYEELVMGDGRVLAPAAYLDYADGDEELVNIARELEPVPDSLGGPLIRSRQQGEDLRLLEAVRMLGANVADIESRLTRAEHTEAERYYQKLRRLLSHEHALWLRLETGNWADEHIVGKIMVARLALFITRLDDGGWGVPGIFPAIFSHDEAQLRTVPEQLQLVDPWLYVQLDVDPEEQ